MTAVTVKTKIRGQLVGFKNKIAKKNVHRDDIYLPIVKSFKSEAKHLAGKQEKRLAGAA